MNKRYAMQVYVSWPFHTKLTKSVHIIIVHTPLKVKKYNIREQKRKTKLSTWYSVYNIVKRRESTQSNSVILNDICTQHILRRIHFYMMTRNEVITSKRICTLRCFFEDILNKRQERWYSTRKHRIKPCIQHIRHWLNFTHTVYNSCVRMFLFIAHSMICKFLQDNNHSVLPYIDQQNCLTR